MTVDERFRYIDCEYTRDELCAAVEAEAAELPSEQWMFGEFEFEAWLSDCLLTGHVQRCGSEDPEMG